MIKGLVNIRGRLCGICRIVSYLCLNGGFWVFMGGRCIVGGRFWGGKNLEFEKGVLEEKELLGVNIIGVLLPEELLGLIRLLVCLSLLLKVMITVPSVCCAMKSGSLFSIFGVRAMACNFHCSGRFMSFHCIYWVVSIG